MAAVFVFLLFVSSSTVLAVIAWESDMRLAVTSRFGGLGCCFIRAGSGLCGVRVYRRFRRGRRGVSVFRTFLARGRWACLVLLSTQSGPVCWDSDGTMTGEEVRRVAASGGLKLP